MHGRVYQRLAARTINKELTQEELKLHALFGLASEVGELQGLFQKAYQGHPLDESHAQKELSDVMWFVAEICTAMGWNLSEIMELNIEKLKARYPEGFDPNKSMSRAEGDV